MERIPRTFQVKVEMTVGLQDADEFVEGSPLVHVVQGDSRHDVCELVVRKGESLSGGADELDVFFRCANELGSAGQRDQVDIDPNSMLGDGESSQRLSRTASHVQDATVLVERFEKSGQQELCRIALSNVLVEVIRESRAEWRQTARSIDEAVFSDGFNVVFLELPLILQLTD